MFLKKVYITIILLASIYLPIYSICNANFHYYENEDMEIVFVNESNCLNEGTIHYYWDFDDGATSYEENPAHIYTTPGIYNVRLTIITSELCYDIETKEVYVGIPPTSPYCLLDICFETSNATSPYYNNGTARVTGFSDIPCCYTALWSNGMEGEQITNLEPGTYCVTLTNGEQCYGTNCVTIGYNNNCSSSFLIDSVTFSHLEGAYRFINNSHGESDIYHWTFGDGTHHYGQNPLHVYSESGTYNVCLEIYTFFGCEDIFCKEITVGSTYPTTANLYGTVFAGNNPLPEGIAVLYQIEDNVFSAIEYSIIEDGEYIFSNLAKDQLYLTHLIPYFNTSETYFPKYLATYSDNEIYWQNNSFINLYTDTIFESSLSSYNEIYYNNGFISGKVFYNDISAYEDSIFSQSWIIPINPEPNLASNIVVLLKDSNHQTIDFDLTNSNGQYFFEYLEYGDYYISVEKAGISSDEIFVSISETQTVSSNNDFNIEQNNINSLETNRFSKHFSLFPNPCSNKIFIESPFNSIEKIELINSEGKILNVLTKFNTHLPVDIYHLPTGNYALKFYHKDDIIIKPFIKL